MLAAGLDRVFHNPQLVPLTLGLAVGAIAAGAAILFRDLIGAVQFLTLGFSSEYVVTEIQGVPWWQVMAVPALGGLAVGLFIRYVVPEGRPHGVPEVMEATTLKGARIDFRTGLGAAVASATSVGVGASVGREGPVVHLGAMLGSFLGQRLHLSRRHRRTLLGCGVASAIAASFNAPIAGVFFALEVVLGHYALSSFAPIVLASVIGTIVSRLYYGNFPAFVLPDHSIVSFLEFPAFAGLGVAAAVVAIVFIRGTVWMQTHIRRLPGPVWIRPGLAGLVIGLVAIEFPHVLGIGYETVDIALAGGFPLFMLLLLLVLKCAMTMVCLGAGFAGGVFSPSLVMGAMLGGAVGAMAAAVSPELASGSGAYAVIGMGAVAGAVLGAPISTILIIFELTSSFALTIAVMMAVVIASVISRQVVGGSFFTVQLARRAVELDGGRERILLRSIRVSEILRTDMEPVPASLSLPRLRESLLAAPQGELFVVDSDGRLVGTITLADLADAAFDTSRDETLCTLDLARRHPPALVRGDTMEDAYRLLEEVDDPVVAVLDDAENRNLIGYVRDRDVRLAHSRALMRARAEERGEA